MKAATVIGNIVDDPKVEFTSGGTAYIRVRVAENDRYMSNGEWKEETSFWTVKIWRDLAENCGVSLVKGARVIVVGKLAQRSWETQEGEKRSTYELTADDIGPSLRWATANVTKVQGNGGGGNYAARPASPAAQAGPAADDPYVVGDDNPF